MGLASQGTPALLADTHCPRVAANPIGAAFDAGRQIQPCVESIYVQVDVVLHRQVDGGVPHESLELHRRPPKLGQTGLAGSDVATTGPSNTR